MIIFNTTFHVEDDMHDMFIFFLKNKYVPKAVESGFLTDPRLAHIYKQHEEKGKSYSLQFRVKDVDTLNQWLSAGEKMIQMEIADRFGHKVMGFITLLEEIDLECDK